MSGRILPDQLWDRIEPLLPPPKSRRFRFPGRKPLDNRKALIGILFVLKTGIRWEDLPQETGLWEWHDLLAALARLASGRSLAGFA